MKDPYFEGIIPKGTPIAQVIPFKRQEWSIKYGSEKEFKEMLKQKSKLFSKFFDKYKSMFWDKKHYK